MWVQHNDGVHAGMQARKISTVKVMSAVHCSGGIAVPGSQPYHSSTLSMDAGAEARQSPQVCVVQEGEHCGGNGRDMA